MDTILGDTNSGVGSAASAAPAPATAAPGAPVLAPRIYYLHPLLTGAINALPPLLDRCAGMGFDHVLVPPLFEAGPAGSLLLTANLDMLDTRLGWTGDALSGISHLAALCRERHLTLLMDVVTDRVAAGCPLAADAGGLYQADAALSPLDPRRFEAEGLAAIAAPGSDAALAGWWASRMTAYAGAGVGGFRLLSMLHMSPDFSTRLTGSVRAAAPGTLFLGWMPGVPTPALAGFVGAGLDFVFDSLPWWDFRGDWFWREAAALRRVARIIATPEAPFGPRLAATSHDPAHLAACTRRAIGFAAAIGDGWMLPMGCEIGATHRLDARRDTPDVWAAAQADRPFDLTEFVAAANAARLHDPGHAGELRVLSAPGAGVMALLRADSADARFARQASVILVNTDPARPRLVASDGLFTNAGASFVPIVPGAPLELAPGDVRILAADAAPSILAPQSDLADTARTAAHTARIAIEAVTPSVDEGRFPARRVVGDLVTVQADIICEGHDVLAAVLAWRPRGAAEWTEVRMKPLGNDRFAAGLPLTRLGMHEFTVEAWRDAFGTYRSELSKKHAAGIDVHLELQEGQTLIERTLQTAQATAGALRALLSRLSAADQDAQIATLLSDEVAELMSRADPRPFAVRIMPPFPLEAERTTARFASWYEIFPRSMSDDATRHGTFDDVIRHLPRIRDMGFDVLYFPPIHPIGRTNRKGRNNTLTPSETDPGSPYAIGAAEGGHDAIHPELGTFDDFRRLRAAAAENGLEIALDFAIQCAPDHPWLRDHRGWFDWRPDGTIKYAENPPKKYQDIVNVDFYATDAIPSLWVELCNVVLFWCDQGVRIFRVDNPHTKPLPFWQWMIAEVKARHPDTMFLAEAFTRPKVMYRLAKIGFSQSYSYFTWRDTRADLTEYLEELSETAPKEFFRPNFFVNTPDINPIYNQHSGRPGFLIKAALATTLSGLWGLYSGFELCEATALPGREEYADAEKYEIKAWDWNRPGNIVAEVTALNWMRRTNPALQTHLGVRFLPHGNPAMIIYEKATPDRANVVLIAVSFDPWNIQETDIEVPLWSWSLPETASVEVDDLVAGTQDVWHGMRRHIRLDPSVSPYAIWRLSPAA